MLYFSYLKLKLNYMDSLQTLTIKSIIETISNNEQLLSIKQFIDTKYKENISQKYKEHYWSEENGKFDDRLSQTTFSEFNDRTCMAVENDNIIYRFDSVLDSVPLLIRDITLNNIWKFNGTWDNFTIQGYKDDVHKTKINDPPKEILDYAIFLWRYKLTN